MGTIHPCCKLIWHAMNYHRERGVATSIANANEKSSKISTAGRDWKEKSRPRGMYQKKDNNGEKQAIYPAMGRNGEGAVKRAERLHANMT